MFQKREEGDRVPGESGAEEEEQVGTQDSRRLKSHTWVPRPKETAPLKDTTVGLSLGPYGGPRGGGSDEPDTPGYQLP